MSVVVDNGSGEVTVEIPENLATATLLNPNTDTYNDYMGIKPPFGLPSSVMPGEVPYTTSLPYLIHPAMHTHPTFVPPSDGSMIQGASPLYANFVPPTQVGGYAGMNTGFAGNTYLPDQQAPYSHNLGGGGGLINPTHDPYNNRIGRGGGHPMMEEQVTMHGTSTHGRAIALAPSEQTYQQASGSQMLFMPQGAPGHISMLSMAHHPTGNWQHSQQAISHLVPQGAIGVPPGTIVHPQPTTWANVIEIPSAYSYNPNVHNRYG